MFSPAEGFQSTGDALETRLVVSRSTEARSSKRPDIVTSNADHILLIDEDPATRQSLPSFFDDHQMPVLACGHDFRRHLAGAEPRLIILDVRLGRDDSLLFLREIRSCSNAPIIITTGGRSDETDRVIALEFWADDYIAKPFSLRELLARVRAVLRRRSAGQSARATAPKQGGFRFGRWQLECRARRLVDPNGNSVALTKGQYVLLVAFLEAPRRLLSREQLLQATRIHRDVFDRSIDIQVSRLRRKLQTGPGAPKIIKTQRGVGYRFTLSVERF
jgi:two-component system, OmpR family, response regulator